MQQLLQPWNLLLLGKPSAGAENAFYLFFFYMSGLGAYDRMTACQWGGSDVEKELFLEAHFILVELFFSFSTRHALGKSLQFFFTSSYPDFCAEIFFFFRKMISPFFKKLLRVLCIHFGIFQVFRAEMLSPMRPWIDQTLKFLRI